MSSDKDKQLSEAEIEQRMTNAVRRALTTPPTPAKELVGKSERAQAQRETKRIRKARQSRPKAP